MSLVWIIWDVSVIPQDAIISNVEIEHELYPHPNNEKGVKLWYRKLDTIYLPPPECMTAWSELRNSPMYLEVEMGDTLGTRHYSLGDSATADLADAVVSQGNYAICVSLDETGSLGFASIPGWNENGPELIVTWRREVGVSRKSWGAIKKTHSQ